MSKDNISEKKEIELLKKMSTSPFDPEPPKRSLLVNLFVNLAKLQGKTPLITPHLYGGDNQAKVKYEYNSAPLFLNA